MERHHVRHFGYLDYQIVFRALSAVVLSEFESKPAGLNTDGGIVLRIEVARTTKNLGRDLVFLQ